MQKLSGATIVLFAALVVFVGFSGVDDAKGDESRDRGSDKASTIRYRINDAHLHFVDFLQQTDGIESLFMRLDSAGVEHSMLNGLAVVKKWDAVDPRKPLYYLADDSRAYWYSATDVLVARAVSGLPDSLRRRVHPFICGFNPTDKNAIDHVKRMIAWYPGLWEGIGEILTRHDDLTAFTYGEQARANHVALDPVYTFAAEQDLPVCIHSDISSVWIHEPLYLHEMEAAVKNHSSTRFIWAHAGISRRVEVPTLVPELRRMLQTYSNLWVDLSWVVYPMDVAPGGIPDKRWVALVQEFPDRFMLGTDKIGHFADYEQTVRQYYSFLDALSPDTARRVARDNFLTILPFSVREEMVTK